MNEFLFVFLFFSLTASSINAQQQYSGNSVLKCNDNGETGESPAFLYSCNGDKHSCRTFLIFRSQLNYNTVTTIANLTSSHPVELARINNISYSAVLPADQEVIVPVKCSCSGKYYQANTTYVTQSIYDTYFIIANDTYQGLSTCNALKTKNSYGEFDLVPGLKLQVPLRCACPTKDQIKNDTKFLLTYLVTWKDTVPAVSKRFNASNSSVAYANHFVEVDSLLNPFTTILIPLEGEPKGPLRSETKISNLSPPSTPEVSSFITPEGLYIGIATGGSVAILCFILFLIFCYLRDDKRAEGFWKSRTARRKWELPAHVLDGIAQIDQVVKIYTIEELEAATDNFSQRKSLSDSVYKGVLRGKLLAIKRMSTVAVEEIKILSKIYHFNVIHLHGLCEHNGHSYLAYEFMENGTLKEWLQKENHVEGESWNLRIVIALDIANGIDYLHNFTTPAYVHKSINCSNILLNKDLRAKVANFSHSRSADRVEDSILSPTRALAEKGYLAPEYIETGKVTSKLDVYAFGVVLLELLSGREAVYVLDGKEVLLADKIRSSMDGSNANVELLNLIDPRLQVKHPLGYVIDQTELALRMVKLSIACLAKDPARRPSMAEVVSALSKIQLVVQKLEPFSVE